MDLSKLPPLPDGFQVQDSNSGSSSSLPPLPDGFQLQNGGPQEKTMTKDPLGTIFDSTKKALKGVNDVVQNIPGTVKGVHDVAVGTVSELPGLKQMPSLEPYRQKAEAVGKSIKDRWGSLDAAYHTLNTDPVGSIMDASVLAGGAGAGLRAAGAETAGRVLMDASTVPGEAVGAVVKAGADKVVQGAKAIPGAMKATSYGLMNDLVRQLPKEFRYGQNGGRGMVKEGIKGNSAEELAQKTSAKLDEISPLGDQIAAGVNTTDNYNPAIKVIDDKISELQKSSPRTNKAAIERLQNSKKDLLGVVEGADGTVANAGQDLSNMTPSEALAFKRKYRDVTQWTGNASDDKLVNSTLQQSYRAIKDQLNGNVPGMRDWNQRYADLRAAETAARRQVSYNQAGQGFGNLFNAALRTSGAAGVLVSAVNGHIGAAGEILGGMLAKEALNSPMVKSNLAQLLYKLSEPQKMQIFKAAPWVKDNLRNIMSGLNKADEKPNFINPVPYNDKTVPEGLPAPQKPLLRADRRLPSPRQAGQSSGPVIKQSGEVKKSPTGLPFYTADEHGRIKGTGFLMGEKRLTPENVNDKLVMAEHDKGDMGNLDLVSRQDKIDNTIMLGESAKEELRMIQEWRKDMAGTIHPNEFKKGEFQDLKKSLNWAKGSKYGSLNEAANDFFANHPEAWPSKFNGHPTDAYLAVAKDMSQKGLSYQGELRKKIYVAQRLSRKKR